MTNTGKTINKAGQPSYVLSTTNMEAYITKQAGMLAPVTFCKDSSPIQPYSVAPWAEETLSQDTPPIIKCLRGDFICSTFGGNDEPFNGKKLPIHGETANNEWSVVAQESNKQSSVLRTSMDLTVQGGRCDAVTVILEGQNVVYQRHDFSGIDGPINPGHHATLLFPDKPGCGALSFSRHIYSHTFVDNVNNPEIGERSFLKPDSQITDLTAVPALDGSTTDTTSFPARRGFEDIAIVCADPTLELAWSAVAIPSAGYAWFSLRNPKLLPSTVLWMSNGGRDFAPWNGRHINVMGIEDITGFFHKGLAASARENMLNKKGIVTCHRITSAETLRVPYIQGVARIPRNFDRVASITPDNDNEISLTSLSGSSVRIPCKWNFTSSGIIENIC